jgi:hypothetical protein
VELPKPAQWQNGDIIQIVDDYKTFDQNPCTLISNGVRINYANPDPTAKPDNATLDQVGPQDYWRFVYYINRSNPNDDQWLYTLSAPSDAGLLPTMETATITGPQQSAKIGRNHIVLASTSGGAITLIPDQSFRTGDELMIVDVDHSFDKNPLTFGGVALDWVGTPGKTDQVFCFLYVAGKFYLKFGPTRRSASSGSATPVVVTGTADHTVDHVVNPGDLIIARTTAGAINLTPSDTFADGDTFKVIDYDWTFDKNQATLKPTDKIKYQGGEDDKGGVFSLDIKGPDSGWAFTYYGGVITADSFPLDQAWINAVSGVTDSAPSSAKMDVQEVAPAQAKGFTTTTITGDVQSAVMWAQYDVDLGRKASMTIKLPPVSSVPDRSRVRIRLISPGNGVVNVAPAKGDPIVGLWQNVNATAPGVSRSVHVQYSMLQLEAHQGKEWMII